MDEFLKHNIFLYVNKNSVSFDVNNPNDLPITKTETPVYYSVASKFIPSVDPEDRVGHETANFYENMDIHL